MPTPILTAAVLSLRRYRVAELMRDQSDRASVSRPGARGARVGEAGRRMVLEFWERYIRNEGTKNVGAVDAVEALRILRTTELRTPSRNRTLASYWNVTAQALSCVERYLDNKISKTGEGGGVRIGQIRELKDYFPSSEASRTTNPKTASLIKSRHARA